MRFERLVMKYVIGANTALGIAADSSRFGLDQVKGYPKENEGMVNAWTRTKFAIMVGNFSSNWVGTVWFKAMQPMLNTVREESLDVLDIKSDDQKTFLDLLESGTQEDLASAANKLADAYEKQVNDLDNVIQQKQNTISELQMSNRNATVSDGFPSRDGGTDATLPQHMKAHTQYVLAEEMKHLQGYKSYMEQTFSETWAKIGITN